jgi:ABC-type transporter Mla maintaining outer membrane lipid asymmetry ATPase subunit MlaF
VSREPLVEMTGVVRSTAEPVPLRIARLRVAPGERLVISGLDAGAAEAFVNLITGAALPEEGTVRVAGHDTRAIATDTEWLASLDRLGIVTARAVLIDQLPIGANVALPLSLAIDPMPEPIGRRVHALADEAGLAPNRLVEPGGSLSPEERVRVHLARALALDPMLLLLEHPTAGLAPAAARALGQTLRRLSKPRNLAWIALSNDTAFAAASGGTRRRLTLGVLRRSWSLPTWN